MITGVMTDLLTQYGAILFGIVVVTLGWSALRRVFYSLAYDSPSAARPETLEQSIARLERECGIGDS